MWQMKKTLLGLAVCVTFLIIFIYLRNVKGVILNYDITLAKSDGKLYRKTSVTEYPVTSKAEHQGKNGNINREGETTPQSDAFEESLRRSTIVDGLNLTTITSDRKNWEEVENNNEVGDGSVRDETLDGVLRTNASIGDLENSAGMSKKRWNVLLIMTDDLRPQLSPYYGEDFPTPTYQTPIITPNFDRLASESVLFTRTFVQYSLCGPSRTSILTGRRPDCTRVFSNHCYWRQVGGNFTTLPQFFKENGYTTVGAGKIFHPGLSSNNNDPISWSEPFYSVYHDGFYEDASRWPSWHSVTDEEAAQVPLTDQFSLNFTLERLRFHAPDAVTGKRPLFLSIGFRKPHISFNCPKKYYDMYPLEEGEHYLRNDTWQSPRVGFPMVNATEKNGEIRISDYELRRLRRGYFACITYVDEMLGQLLDEVDRVGLTDNTIVVFIADHGYHLGENDHWGKRVVYELANRVPFMIRIPGTTQPGYRSSSIVQALDLFPTLAELTGLGPVPKCRPGSSDTPLCVEGVSLVPLIEDPEGQVRDCAISQVLRGGNVMEYTIRTKRFRYCESALITSEEDGQNKYTVSASWQLFTDYPRMLFDHQKDPEETRNLAYDPQYNDVVADLHDKLVSHVETVYKAPTVIT